MTTTNDPPLTMTQKTLAAHLNLSVRTIQRLRAIGRLPAPLPGCRRPRWASETVLAWLRATGRRR